MGSPHYTSPLIASQQILYGGHERSAWRAKPRKISYLVIVFLLFIFVLIFRHGFPGSYIPRRVIRVEEFLFGFEYSGAPSYTVLQSRHVVHSTHAPIWFTWIFGVPPKEHHWEEPIILCIQLKIHLDVCGCTPSYVLMI